MSQFSNKDIACSQENKRKNNRHFRKKIIAISRKLSATFVNPALQELPPPACGPRITDTRQNQFRRKRKDRSGFRTAADDKNIKKQDDVHQKSIDNCGNGHLAAIENEWGKRYGDGLGGILHSDLDDDCAADGSGKTTKTGNQRTAKPDFVTIKTSNL